MVVNAFTGRGHRRNLRERFRRVGVGGFAVHEILELILSYSIPRKDVKPIAKRIITFKEYGLEMVSCDRESLEEISGIGSETSSFLAFFSDVVEHFAHEGDFSETSDELIYLNELCKLLCERMMDEDADSYIAVYLDDNFQFNSGNIEQLKDATVVRRSQALRAILSQASFTRCHGVILCRNNAGKNGRMSGDDERFVRALSILLNALSVRYLGLLLFDENFVYCTETRKVFKIAGDECVLLDAGLDPLISS
jgi:DNA repair protein RadC